MRYSPLSMNERVRHTSALAIGSAASGLLAYLFFVVVIRALGSTAAAPVSVLWTYWSFAGAALTFPLQHWVARSMAAHEGERAVRAAVPGVAVVTVVVSVVAVGGSWLLRDQLFGVGQPWFPLLVGGVTLGSAAMGLMRGVLSGRHRFPAVAGSLVGENAVRCVVALGLAWAGVDDPVAYGLALLAGYVLVTAQPSTYRLAASGLPSEDSPLGFLGGAAGGQLLGQTVFTGGPVVLALLGGSAPSITALFAGLALFRAPYTLAIGVVAQVTGTFTRLVVEGRVDALRHTRKRLLLAAGVTSVAAAAVGWLIGPWALQLVFGADVTLGRGLTLLLAVGSTIAMVNLVFTLVVLAHNRTQVLVLCWLGALIPGALCLAFARVPVLDRTCWAFVAIEATALGLLVVQEVRATSSLRR